MIYEPAEDSYLLEKYVTKYSKGKVLDMGCGSGIQSLAALSKADSVLSVDINSEAVSFCKSKGLNAIESDLFFNVNGKFDLIIFNPPYLPKDNDEDKESALVTTGGEKGIEILEKFFLEVKDYLNEDGKVLIVFSSLTGDVDSLLNSNGFKFEKLESKKVFFEEMFVYLCSKS